MVDGGAISEEALQLLKKAGTGVVSDALGMAGLQGGVIGIRPARGFEETTIVGPAATVHFAPPHPATPRKSTYHAVREFAPGSVMVMDAQGQTGHHVGDNVAEYARRQGLVGIVVNGSARDVVGFRQVGMPLFCTGLATRPTPFQLTATNVPVQIGGVLVKPGDVVVGDEDGVVVVPREALQTVLENVRAMFQIEADMKSVIRRDGSPDEIAAILAKKKPKR